MAKKKGRKMAIGECRRTKKGQTYCRTRTGVRFRQKAMADIADMGEFYDLGESDKMRQGECRTVIVRGGERKICNLPQGVRFVPMSELGYPKGRGKRYYGR